MNNKTIAAETLRNLEQGYYVNADDVQTGISHINKECENELRH